MSRMDADLICTSDPCDPPYPLNPRSFYCSPVQSAVVHYPSQEKPELEIDFDDIRHLIPPFVFNEYGQLTGNFVRRDDIVCVHEEGRVQVWLNRTTYDARDANGLIIDYDERRLFPEQ